MRTEEQDWQDLEKKLNPKTVDCSKRECGIKKWIHKKRMYLIRQVRYMFQENRIDS